MKTPMIEFLNDNITAINLCLENPICISRPGIDLGIPDDVTFILVKNFIKLLRLQFKYHIIPL